MKRDGIEDQNRWGSVAVRPRKRNYRRTVTVLLTCCAALTFVKLFKDPRALSRSAVRARCAPTDLKAEFDWKKVRINDQYSFRRSSKAATVLTALSFRKASLGRLFP